MRKLYCLCVVSSLVLNVSLHSLNAQCNLIGNIIFVTSTADSGPGSLREAIDCANATPGVNNIYFNIPGFQDQIIYVGAETGEPLPALTDQATIIDGTTQPGHGVAGDFSPRIILDGSLVNWTVPINALFIQGANCAVFGLEIRHWPDDGIDVNNANNVQIGGVAKYNIIYDCGWEQDFFPGAPGTGPWQGCGIVIKNNSNNCTVEANIIGTDENGTVGLGNEFCGILNLGASLNTIIGATSTSGGNIITGNPYGVLISGGYSVEVRRNSIYCNGKGIELTDGGNFSKTAPQILLASPEEVSGTASPNDIVELFLDSDVSCTGADCQGKVYLGTAVADGDGSWTISGPFDNGNNLNEGDYVTATATDFIDNTSEFANCASVLDLASCTQPDGIIYVTNTNDEGPGSLRQAILCANALAGPNNIYFNISGQGPHAVFVGTQTGDPLPLLTDDGTVIDATTQNGFGEDENFQPMIVLDGLLNNWDSPDNAILILGDDCEVYGLEIRNFPDDGIDITGAENCIIGAPEKGNVIYYCGSPVDFFPGLPNTGPWEGCGIVLKNGTRNCVVQSNIVGTNYLQNLDGGNEFCGIIVQSEGQGHLIGGPGPNEGNLVFYNASGILIDNEAFSVRLQNNSLVCNDTAGIVLRNGANFNKTSPEIDTASNLHIGGKGIPGDWVEVFLVDTSGCESSPCQGRYFLGNTFVANDSSWHIDAPFADSIGLLQDDLVLATATDTLNNTSAYSNCYQVNFICDLSIDEFIVGNDTCFSNLGALTLAVSGSGDTLIYELDGQNVGVDLLKNLSSGTHTIKVTDNFNCSLTETFEVENVDLASTAQFLVESNNLITNFNNISLGATNYQWTFGDGSVSTEESPTHVYDTTGLYDVCLIAEGGCQNDTICKKTAVFAQFDRVIFDIGDGVLVDGLIRIPFRVREFLEIVGFQFTIQKNSSELHFVGLENFALTGLSGANFDIQDSLITCSWADPTISGQTLPDSTVIFELLLESDSSFSGCAEVFLSQNPTPFEVVRFLDGEIVKTTLSFTFGEVCLADLFSGKIAGENGDPLNNAIVFTDIQAPDTTISDGSYRLAFSPNQALPFTIDPWKDVFISNGVTTFDMFKIQRHLLFIELLDSPYKHIAADVDNNGVITTFDLTLIRLVILFISNSFPNNESWRFVAEEYQFDNPDKPLIENFPEMITIEDYDDLNGNLNFVAIKVGDVTLDANTTLVTEGERLKLYMKTFEDRRNFRVAFYLEDRSDLASFQGTLGFGSNQDVEFHSDTEGFYFNATDELFSFLWWDVAGGLGNGLNTNEPLFEARFKSKSAMDAFLADVNIKSRPTASKAFSVEGEEMSLDLFQDVANANIEVLNDGQQFSAMPNPFDTQTHLVFELEKQEDVTIRIFDLQGRLVWTKELSLGAGEQSVTLHKVDLNNQSGVYLVKLFVEGEVFMQKVWLKD